MIRTIVHKIDNAIYVKQLLKQMEKAAVYVGVPEDTTERKKDPNAKKPMTNSYLLAIHTHGSPLRNILARPVLEPAITDQDNKDKINRHLLLAAQSMVKKDKTNFMLELERAGMQAQNAARRWFVNPKNNWPPLSAATKASKGSEQPLIDTGQLRKSITYAVREKHD